MERKKVLKKLGIQETILDNGFKILTKHMPEIKTVQSGIAVRFGSIYENDEINGIAHFFEHMVFKGTKTKSSQDVLRILDELGGVSNAYTDWDNVVYFVTTPTKHFSKAINLLSDLVLNPALDRKELETERGVIIQEIAMHKDNPWIVANGLLYQELYEKNPIRRRILGPAENIKRFTRDDFLRIHQERYAVNNLFLVLVGGIKHEDAVKQVIKYFKNVISRNILIPKRIPDDPIKPKRLIVEKPNLTEAKLFLGFRAPYFKEKDFYIMKVIASILGQGWTSRLVEEIREKRGWSYATGASCETSLVHSALVIYTNLPNKKIVEAEAIIIRELTKIKHRKVPDEELKRHVDGLITRYIIKQEQNRSSFWFMKIIDAEIRNHFEAALKGVEPLKKVVQEDILRVANKYIDTENYVLAAVKGRDK